MSSPNNESDTESIVQRRLILELEQDRDKYKALFELSADALSIIDLETGKFIECNQSAVDMHGVESSENFLNLGPSDLSPKCQPCGRSSDEMAREYVAKTFTHGPQVFQWVHSKLDGSTFPCLVSLTALSLQDKNYILAIGRDISDLVKAQEDLRGAALESKRLEQAYLQEKEKFEKFVNLAPVGIAINSIRDGSFEFVNKEFGRITGYGVEELNQMDYWQLTPSKYETQEAEQLESLNKSGQYGPYLKEYIHKSGCLNPVLLSGIKITDSNEETFIWSVVQDMSQQKEIERQIQEAKEKADSMAFRMQLANNSAGIGVWEWDLISGELVWDSWMYKLYGVSPQQFSGAYEAWASCVHPEDIDEAKSKLDAAIYKNGTYEPEFRVVHPNGEIRTMKASAQVIKSDKGEPIKVIGVNYDITDKVNAIQVLSEAKAVAENAAKAKSDFLANMSHEIRTPMNAILGGLQLLKGADLTPELNKVLNNASFSAQSLLSIINDILDYSKIESNNLDLECSQFSLTEVLESVKYDLDALVSSKRIEFTLIKEKTFSEYWYGDLVRVKQIILNLASNAVKFTEKGFVSINVGTRKKKGIPTVYLEVADSGIGMSKETQDKIFERFTQADASTTRKYGGTGLGMSITISLVKMMGGTIELNSKLEKGTTVKVTLPLKLAGDATKPELRKSLSPPDLSNKRILIAEDNAVNKVLIESMLKVTNADLTIVEHGKLAVDEVSRKAFDLVLMDIHMPVMDGLEAQKIIKLINPQIPVVALTANVMKEDVERYLAEGFVAHIAKPFDINDLYGLLKNTLN